MKTITFDGAAYHCPLTERFRRHTAEELADMRESIRTGGIRREILTYHDKTLDLRNCILDGEGRLGLAAELGLTHEQVPMIDAGGLGTEEAFQEAKVHNDHRRQDSPEEVRKRRQAKVAELRERGMSTRAIAGEVGASQTQVRRDLRTGEPHGSPEPSPESNAAAAEPARVTGRDNKKYPAHRHPALRALRHFKPGNNVDRTNGHIDILDALANLTRLFTQAVNAPGGEKLKQYLTALRMIDHKDVIEDGTKYGAKFRGLVGLRRVVTLAGKAGKLRSDAEVRAEYERLDEGAET